MSYLHTPRLHFAGRFQAVTSTVNNDVRHFDDSQFRTEFQEPMKVVDEKVVKYNGYWNPEGTGAWRMLGCRITSAVLGDEAFTSPEQDPAVGLLLGGSDDRVAGKLVDLDPQQQMVSQIWGLAIRLQHADGQAVFDSDFAVAPFCDIWLRQQKAQQFFDQQLAAVYQSVLEQVSWSEGIDSPTLAALRERSADGLLSIRMNVFGYDRTPGAQDYSSGVVRGTIGPAEAAGPKRFTLGRQLVAALSQDPNLYPFVPTHQVSNIQAVVEPKTCRVSADFGNALPIETSEGDFEDIGSLFFGVLKTDAAQGDVVTSAEVEILGPIPYQRPGWYRETAGIVDFDGSGNGWIRDHIAARPLAVLGLRDGSSYQVLNQETADGVYLRADNFVYRLDPGESACVDFYATRYGAPLAATATLSSTSGFMGGAGTGAHLPKIEIPDVNTPEGIVTYAGSLQTAADGHGTLTLTASENGPGTPRLYLDGQVYGVAYQLDDLPPGYNSNPFNYVSILAWDLYEIPQPLTWFGAIQPILQQYANLYPIMSRRLFDLADYECVVNNLDILKLSFSLPIEDPNSMPVTRDLSAHKRRAILQWLDSADPATGLPPLGDPPATEAHLAPSAAPAPEEPGDQPDLGSKVGFVRQAQAAAKQH